MANKPNNPELWSRAKSLAKQKFDVYPSAYANGWAAKWYKSKGGTWRKAQDGMNIMREGGINNPGFKALPKQVQQNIIQNMSKGGNFNDAELLRKHKAGESIGFTAIAHLKAKGLIPRADGEKRVSDKYKKDGGRLPNYKSGMKGTGAQPQESIKLRNKIKPSSLMKFGGNTKIEHGSAYYQDGDMIQSRPFVNQRPVKAVPEYDKGEKMNDYLTFNPAIHTEPQIDTKALESKAEQLGVDMLRFKDLKGTIYGFDPKKNYSLKYKNITGNPERVPGEYHLQQGGRVIKTEDPDGEMALGQIRSMHDNLYQLEKLIDEDSELEPWVNSKLTLANDYLDVVADYMKYNPENEEGGEYTMDEEEYEEYQSGGGIPTRYKNMGFTKVGQKKQGDGIHKWKVLAKKGDKYKVVQGGWRGMEDFKQHGSEKRRKNFWNRMGGKDSARAKDPFSPLYWHKRFGTWQDGGPVFNPNVPVEPVAASIFNNINQMKQETPIMRKGGYSSCMQCGGSMKFKKGGSCGCGKLMKYGKGGSFKDGTSENFKIIHESDVLHPGDSRNLATKGYSGDKPVGFMYTKTINKTIKR